MQRLGILLSGRGSNFIAIAEAIRERRLHGAEIAVVLSNLPDAAGLVAARNLSLTAIAIPSAGRKRAEHDAELIAALREHRVDLVCLAGYMRIVSPEFVHAFPNSILNIHPSLLPTLTVAILRAYEARRGVEHHIYHFVSGRNVGLITLRKDWRPSKRETAQACLRQAA
ncbi:MAG: formyltransferase family protein [Acidobacteriaceae bacterium]